jgi:hypothetical protein
VPKLPQLKALFDVEHRSLTEWSFRSFVLALAF